MPVSYVIRFTVAPGRRESFLRHLELVLDAMRHEPNFHEAVLHVDPEDPDRMMLYETWEDHEDVVAVQLKRPYREAYHAALPELLAGPRDVSIWRPIRADRRPAG